MHYDDMISPIYKSFLKYLEDCRYSQSSAFYWALKDNIEQLNSRTCISREVAEHGGEDYIKHVEEKRGLEIGKAINEDESLFESIRREGFMGTEIDKNVFVVKLKKEEVRN